MKHYSLDRIEDGDIAVLIDKDGTKNDVLLTDLPECAKPGDVFIFDNGRYVIDKDDMENRRKRINEKRKKLLEKSNPPK